MIKFIKGNIFESNAEALVNSVNTVGVMGKGIALQFKERFPENYRLYKKTCEEGRVTIGKMFVTSTNSLINPRWIINFPTKKHWMHRSSYGFIEAGLDDLIKVIKDLNIKSIAIPPIGAGQGGLKWEKVKRIIEDKLGELDIEILVYEPDSINLMPISTNAKLTKQRAMLLYLVELYRVLGYEITLLEIQKVAYFLQRLGQADLKLQFKKYYYGPYAHNLQHLLHHLRGSYLLTEKPILDSRPYDNIYLNNEKLAEIKDFIDKYCSDTEIQRIEIISKIIEGFESPFGLELLATVDWILFNDRENKIQTIEDFQKAILRWSKRKYDVFKKELIEIAFKRLMQFKEKLYPLNKLPILAPL
ncbi:ADP-ribose-binding domain-containing protein [Dissulfurispira thermophila]|uniref:ADP-ribose-binding domain-containing protein n=1 Tax=Dissulfurispira thermophila TaxID=2715679 RepID=A0A7G1H4E4_9BACT|nr:macro domain-containing protein [Dissulfurispira thermophila]BCB97069.1 ADP-ribose-binding domain-containing protein [Dissulfurispira thermophila]